MQDIRIDVGVCTVFHITLLEEHFTGVKEIIFTVKNYPSVGSEVIIERTFKEAGKHEIVVNAEESVKLCNNAEYDFNAVLENGTRLKMTDNGKIILRKSVGDCID